MADKDYDWLEDPFNEEKAKQELEEAKKSRNRGLLIILVVAVVLIFALFASCNAAFLFMGA